MAEDGATPAGGDLADVGRTTFNGDVKPAGSASPGGTKAGSKDEFPWVALVIAVATITLTIGFIAGIMHDTPLRK